MKVRTDYVTNSSSSSFILARNGVMNEKQKEEILEYVERMFLGQKLLTPDSSEEEIAKIFDEEYLFRDEDVQQKVREVLKEGKSITYGWVEFEECEYNYASVFEDIWRIMEEYGEDDFVAIEDDLSY